MRMNLNQGTRPAFYGKGCLNPAAPVDIEAFPHDRASCAFRRRGQNIESPVHRAKYGAMGYCGGIRGCVPHMKSTGRRDGEWAPACNSF